MTNAPKTVLAIHDLPGFGRAALSVIVPVLSTLGVQTVALPTAVLSTHTGGLGTPAKLANPGYGPAALEHYHRLGVKFDCIYSGYLADAAQAKLVEQAFELWPRAFKVVDPVLGDGGRRPGAARGSGRHALGGRPGARARLRCQRRTRAGAAWGRDDGPCGGAGASRRTGVGGHGGGTVRAVGAPVAAPWPSAISCARASLLPPDSTPASHCSMRPQTWLAPSACSPTSSRS